MISFFFKDAAPTEIYTLSLHDALPIYSSRSAHAASPRATECRRVVPPSATATSGSPPTSAAASATAPGGTTTTTGAQDRKSTRLNSSHANISYAVFCLKKKKKTSNGHN